MRVSILLLCYLYLMSCKPGPSDDIQTPPDFRHHSFEALELTLEQMGNCDSGEGALCQRSDFELSFPSPVSVTESIMVVDQVGLWSMAGKYFERTQAFEMTLDGKLKPYVKSIPLSQGMQDILGTLRDWGRQAPAQAAPNQRDRGSDIFARMTKNSVLATDLESIGIFGHGSTIFGYLAENNSDASLLALVGPIFPAPVLCAFRNGSVASYARELARNMAELAKANRVSYINASFGFSYSLAQSRLQKECQDQPTAEEVVAVVAEQHILLSELARLSDAQIIQAANESVEDWRMDREVSDCDDALKTKRKRIGYYFSEGPEYAAESLSLKEVPASKIPWTLGQRSACVDLFIDSGFTDYLVASHEPFDLTIDGLMQNRNFLMATSYATPIALTFLRREAMKQSLNVHDAFMQLTEASRNRFIHWGSNDRNELFPSALISGSY